MKAICCTLGYKLLEQTASGEWAIARQHVEVNRCPWCGWNLARGYWPGY